MKKLIFTGVVVICSLICFAQQPSFITDSLDLYIQRGLKDWQLPGLAIVIVKDGKVVVMKGYGTKEAGKNDPVDENTLFMIASNTKLFTGTALAKLEYEKKLMLDDKVSKYIPGFRIYDEDISKLVTIRDLLSHRLGTKTFQGDFTFWNSGLPRKEVINRMRLLKPTAVFRQNYGYCNSCFTTAGEIIPIVTGSSWENYIADNFLKPLGMTNSYPLTAGFGDRKNIALPYTNTFGPLSKVPFDRIDNMAPAGSIVSNVKDISQWLLMQLDSGKLDGKTIVPWPVVRATRDMNISTGSRKSDAFPTHFRGYGLGVFMSDYNGRAIYYHTGGADGYVTNTCFIPEERLGISILTNNDNQNFFEALRYQVMDAYLGVPYTDRSKFYLNFHKIEDKQVIETINKYKTRVAAKQKPELELKNYAGVYNNPIYGKITIKEKSGKLTASFENHPDLTASLEYMDKNEFLTTYSHAGYGIFPAKTVIENGKVKSIELKVNDFLEYDPYVFVKE